MSRLKLFVLALAASIVSAPAGAEIIPIREIEQIDAQVLMLLQRRQMLAERQSSTPGAPAETPAQQLTRIRELAEQTGLDPEIVGEIWGKILLS